MGASRIYGKPSGDEERLKFLDQAYERGEQLWDTCKDDTQKLCTSSSSYLNLPYYLGNIKPIKGS